jgi:hypothetical protein
MGGTYWKWIEKLKLLKFNSYFISRRCRRLASATGWRGLHRQKNPALAQSVE